MSRCCSIRAGLTPVLLAFVLFLAGCVPIAGSIPPPRAEGTTVCPVTQPGERAYTPPAPYPATPPGEDHFWHGSDALWTALPKNGVWAYLPRQADGYGQKFFAWRVGYDPMQELQPALVVEGRRLDGDAPPLTGHEPATHAFAADIVSAMLTGLAIPTAGCWEVTATYRPETDEAARLTFVIAINEE